MTRVRRRQGASRRELTESERSFLLHGHRPEDRGEEADARMAWPDVRGELEAEVAARSGGALVPWASIFLDGGRGHSSRYCHLGATRCHRQGTPARTAPLPAGGPA
jgi:hypothetical protein